MNGMLGRIEEGECMKRPLTVLCLAYTTVMILITLLLPVKPPDEGLQEGEWLVITGKVIQKEIKKEHLIVTCLINSGSDSDPYFHKKVNCYFALKENRIEPKIGSLIQVEGKVSLFSEADNPGEFDLRQYYHADNIAFSLKSANLIAQSIEYDRYREGLSIFRKKCCSILEQSMDGADASVLKAMLFGNKTELDTEIKDLFSRSGISHVLAISGLHISMIGMACYRGFRRMNLPIWVSVMAGLATILTYGFLTGMSISAIRAIVMFGIRILADLAGRTYDAITALSLAAAFVAYDQPTVFFTSGVQMSFVTVFGIILCKPVFDSFSKKGRCLYGGIMILLVTFPLVSWHYYSYSVYSILLNFCVVPLLSILMVLGFCTVFVGFFSIPLANIVGRFASFIIGFYEIASEAILRLPGATWTVGRPKMWQIIVYYLSISLLIYVHRRLSKQEIVLWLMVAFCLLNVRAYEKNQIAFLSVGQGDALVLMNQRGECVTIDGGSSSESNVGEYTLIPYLQYYGIDTISYAFITHLDEDHYSAIVEMMEDPQCEIRLKCLVMSSQMQKLADEEQIAYILRLAKESDTKVVWISEGSELRFGDFSCRCVWPGESEQLDDINAGSLVFEVAFDGMTGLLTGDISEAEEKKLTDELCYTSYDFLKAAHHGSKYSSSEDFLQRVSPRICIISAGEGNRYGHPHEETLLRLQENGIKVHRTDLDGAIEISTEGRKQSVTTFRKRE